MKQRSNVFSEVLAEDVYLPVLYTEAGLNHLFDFTHFFAE